MQYIQFMDMNLFEMSYYFFFWSTFGWCLEVVDRTLETGAFENRGFLNGPFCPIYGVGVLTILVLLRPFEKSIIVLYVSSTIICSTVELSVGILLQCLFKTKWWDYSDKNFNYKGYICLKISLLWGVGCVVMMNVVHPILEKVIDYIPHTFGNIMIILMYSILLCDLIASICEVEKFNNRLHQIDDISNLLHDKSIAIGENISDEVLELRSKYNNMIEQTKKHTRLLKAFPKMSSVKYNDTLKTLKDKFNINKNS